MFRVVYGIIKTAKSQYCGNNNGFSNQPDTGVSRMTKRNHTTFEKTKSNKKTLCGVGYNTGGKHPSHKNNKISKEYSVWSSMIRRCYEEKDRDMFPAYGDCTVSDDWLDFQRFAEWYVNHRFYGMDYCLDKDLLIKGNTVYSESTCSLVPHAINTILLSCTSRRGLLPQGVYLDKVNNKYKAQISIDGKVVSLGRFKTVAEASDTYVKAKERHVKNMALKWANRIEWDVFKNLMQWSVSK